MEKYIIFGSPHIEEQDIREVVDSLHSGWLSTGPKVAKFEKMFADYIGASHACALGSCTAGLHLALLVVGVKPGDEIITSPMTFAATANVIEHLGAQPVFIDIERDSMNIDVSQISSKVTKRTKAILPVHFAGRPCDMEAVIELAKKHDLHVIEDAAHCTEGEYRGRKIGTIGDLTAFSFYATKSLSTGEGGMVTTHNEHWAEKIKVLSSHGLSRDAWKRYSSEGNSHYQVVVPGYPYNMMDLQAAIGIHQLLRLSKSLQRRDEIWRMYDEAFEDLPVETPASAETGTVHARHLYTVLVDSENAGRSRDGVRRILYEQKVGSGVHFISLHMHPYYANKYGYAPEDFPNAMYVSERTMSLPLSSKLSDDDVARVIVAVKKALRK
ncbi:MAG: DegT/DnrJ/EryC1/StrS family aminotransferase [Gemmatimonadota bacterium]|nr:MAG: DegT/DnrJ/EryC1/StrS family aminotransferase [Gemmatimonadota bacterium]